MYFTLFFKPHYFEANLTSLQRAEYMAFAQCVCVLSFPKEYEATQNARGPALLTLVAGFFPVPQRQCQSYTSPLSSKTGAF